MDELRDEIRAMLEKSEHVASVSVTEDSEIECEFALVLSDGSEVSLTLSAVV